MKQSHIIFFGTSHHSAQFLKQATELGLKVDLVVSAPPKPVGKKQILTENPVVTLAKKLNLPSIVSLGEISPAMQQCNNETIGLILDYNVIIPKEIIDLFPKGIINIHFSKLPQYRGPAPVQYTILNGDRQAWITYYLINEKLDAGQILAQTLFPLDMTENTETLYQKLITKSAGEISEIIDNYLYDRYDTCQQSSATSMTHKLTSENCQIHWSKPAVEIERLIRAAYPEPGAWTSVEFKVQKPAPSTSTTLSVNLSRGSKCKVMRLKILKAHLEQGKLTIDRVQLEGKNPVTWEQFQQGYPKFAFK